ncbi:MAG: hypothetical protein J0M10_16800 [Chitinophagales bacterium]|nr:hypothetical protein [Chitinophagales bacterium]
MKKAIAFILLLVFTVQSCYASVFTLWFYANRKAIAAEHCINKDRPELKCDGKCFLKMKLQENSQHQDEDAPLQVKQQLESSPYTTVSCNHQLLIPETGKTTYNQYNRPYKYLHSIAIFHPPLQA